VHVDASKLDSNLVTIPEYPITDLDASVNIVTNPSAGVVDVDDNGLIAARYAIVSKAPVTTDANARREMIVVRNAVMVVYFFIVDLDAQRKRWFG
jgi:hypothetical protein